MIYNIIVGMSYMIIPPLTIRLVYEGTEHTLLHWFLAVTVILGCYTGMILQIKKLFPLIIILCLIALVTNSSQGVPLYENIWRLLGVH